jgi:cyclopropane fatty-acyl-phospholipid synthase-like methyltransferase
VRRRDDREDVASSVRAYYERNTRLFLALGIGRRTLAMRRAVWAHGVESLPQAVDYVNGLVAAEAARMGRVAATAEEPLRMLDIGCGVGGSLFFLAGAVGVPMRGVGITISPRQAVSARRQAQARGLSSTCTFIAADFSRVTGLPPSHLAFAIESFVHFTAPSAFFASAAASLAPGGRLVVIDDFISRESRTGGERRLLETFREGWVVPSLCPVPRATGSAAACGLRLVEDRDLSPFLSTPPASRLGGGAARVMRAGPVTGQYWRSTMGSLALAWCQQAGLVGYHYLVYEKERA